jgi:hypothetical protein
VVGVSHGLVDDIQRTLSDLADLRQGGAVYDGLHTGAELGQKGAGLNGVVDELGQVLDYDDGLTGDFLSCGGGVERALEQRGDHSQHGGRDNGDEGGLREGVDGYLQTLCGGVLDGLDEQRYPGRDVVVLEERGEAVHRFDRLFRDLCSVSMLLCLSDVSVVPQT